MITQEYLKELFDYNGQDLVWRVARGSAAVGAIAGCIDLAGYRIIRIKGKGYKAHRLIWLYHYGELPDFYLDHIDQDKVNNSINNLRPVDHQMNMKNRALQANNKSGCVGVRICKVTGKWRAQGKIDSRYISLGSYTEKWDAICARKSWEVRNGFSENHGC